MTEQKLFVQVAEDSFNHGALACLEQGEEGAEPKLETMDAIADDPNVQFVGHQKNVMDHAVKEGGTGFVAIENDIVPDRLIPSTIEALQEYEVTGIRRGVLMKIDMCLFGVKDDDTAIHSVASHPAALSQIGKWKAGKDLAKLPDAQLGTSGTVRKLAEGGYASGTVAVGPKWSGERHDNLVLLKDGVQDHDRNKTLFAELEVRRRETPVDKATAQAHLAEIRDALVTRIDRVDGVFSHIADIPEEGLQVAA